MHADPATPACVTVDRWSPTVMVATRWSSARLGATLNATVASPLPRTGVVNEIQLASVAAVQEHALPPETRISRVSPAAATVRLAGWRPKRQAAGCWDTRNGLSLTTISTFPHRRQWIGRHTKLNRAWALSRGRRHPDSQSARVDTSQGHSGDVVTVRVPVPPSAPMLGDAVDNATWHFTWVGVVATAELELQPAVSATAAIVAADNRR